MLLARRFSGIFIVASVLVLAPTSSQGQGIPWHTIPLPVPGGFVDVLTGNVHLEIVLRSVPQRSGDPIVSKILYDHAQYIYQFGRWEKSGPGWRHLSGNRHYGNSGMSPSGQSCSSAGFSGYPYGSVTTWSNFYFTDINGTTHSYGNSLFTRKVNCQNQYGVPYGTGSDIPSASGTEGSAGYTFQVTNYNQWKVYAADGTLVHDNVPDQYESALPLDTNGNTGTGSQPNSFPAQPLGFFCPAYPPIPPTYTTSSTVTTSSGSPATYTFTCTAGNVSNVQSGTGTVSFPTTLTLPDGTSYSFTYDTGTSGNHWGSLLSVTLPTGGTVSFTYTSVAPGTPLRVQSVTFGGGTWNLSYALNSPSSGQTTTTVFAPLRYDSASGTNVSDKAVFTSVPSYPHLKTAQYYSGFSTLLRTVNYTYALGFLPITVTTTLNDTGQSSSVFYQYHNGLRDYPSQKQETDFTGAVVRTTRTTYGVFNKPTDVNVYSGSGTGSPIASTLYTYDEYSANYCKNGVPMLASFTGAYGHDDANFGTSATNRGNVTTIQRLISGTTYSATHFCYDTLGNVTQTVDANGNPTTYDYSENRTDTNCIPSGTVTHAFRTTVTDALGFRRRTKYYTCGILPQSLADENDLRAGRSGTAYTYDAFNRPLTINYPDVGQTSKSYPNATTLITTKAIDTRNLQTTAVLDGLGRTIQTQLNTDPQGTVFTDTTYDSLGRVATVSNPYRSSAESTYGITTTHYDALARVTRIIPPDGTASANNVTTTYSGTCTTVTDQAGKGRKSCADALGRLVQVFEPNASGSLVNETAYQYNALDNLTCVEQRGNVTGTGCSSPPSSDATSAWRVRRFTYNSLSQLTQATNPESGTISYTYDAAGNLLAKTAPAPNQTGSATVTTTYAHDALHRLTSKSYSDGTTPGVIYTYDVSNPFGLTASNPVGRRVAAWTGFGGQWVSWKAFSYDPVGRATQWSCLPSPPDCGGAIAANVGYDLAGNIISEDVMPSVTLTRGYNSAAQPSQLTSNWVDSQHPATVASGITYTAAGAVAQMIYGNGLADTRVYNKRLQPTQFRVYDPSTGADSLNMTYGFNAGTANNGNVASWSATGAQSFSRNYTYDELNRLKTMSGTGGPCTGLSWTYDIWGNRTDQNLTAGSCGQFHATVNTQNRLVGPPYQYDAAGNVTFDGSHSYTYDAENRVTKVDGGNTATYLYDPDGRRTQKTVGASTTNYLYNLAGEVIADKQGSNWVTLYVYSDGQLLAQYAASTTRFVHKDHLGSIRGLTAMDKSVVDSLDYLPFGEQIAGGSGSTHKFTGKERDSESGLDNFGARYYMSSLGRWTSPDLINLTRERLLNPSNTINKYTYAGNNPLKYVDPNGQDITIFYRRGNILNPIDSGHAFVAVLNQQTGQVAFLSFAPKSANSPIGEGAYNANLSLESIKKHASITIQTSPEAAQKAIEAIQKLQQSPAGTYNVFTNNCTTECERILRIMDIATTDSIHPDDLWNWAYKNYSDDVLNPEKRVQFLVPYKPGTEFGQPRISGPGFDYQRFLWELYLSQRRRPEPTRERGCVTTLGPGLEPETTCD